MPRRIVCSLVGLFALRVVPLRIGAQEATPGRTVAAGVTTETLVATTIPAETVPTGEAVVWFARITSEPGAVQSYPSSAPSRSVAVEVVVTGSYALRSAPVIRPHGRELARV